MKKYFLDERRGRVSGGGGSQWGRGGVSGGGRSLERGLRGSLSKSGPLHFGSEKSFPSNFSQ